jgi:hypothetical protein
MIFPDTDSVCLQYFCKLILGTDRYDLKARIRNRLSRIYSTTLPLSKNVDMVSLTNLHYVHKYFLRKHSLPNGYKNHCLKSFSAISVFFMYRYFFKSDLSAASASNVCETSVHYLWDLLVNGIVKNECRDIYTSSAKQRLRHLLIIFVDFSYKLQAN